MEALQQLLAMCDVIEEHEEALAILLEEMSGLGRSFTALNPGTLWELQKRNLLTGETVNPPDRLWLIVLVPIPKPNCGLQFLLIRFSNMLSCTCNLCA